MQRPCGTEQGLDCEVPGILLMGDLIKEDR